MSNEKDNTITVLDGQTLAITDTVKVGQRPRAILLSVDGKSLYITESETCTVLHARVPTPGLTLFSHQ